MSEIDTSSKDAVSQDSANISSQSKKACSSHFVKTKLLGDDGSFIIGFNQIFDELVTFTGDAKNAYKTGIEDNQSRSIFLLYAVFRQFFLPQRSKTSWLPNIVSLGCA